MENECQASGGKYERFRVTYVTVERNPSGKGVTAAAPSKDKVPLKV